MFPVYKILAGLAILVIVGIIVAVSFWFQTDAGRDFKKRHEFKRRQEEEEDDD